jgi:hypothetical protein
MRPVSWIREDIKRVDNGEETQFWDPEPTPLWPEEPKKKEKKDEPGIEFQEEYFR